MLDKIKVKGKNEPVTIYEIFDADDIKNQYVETFEKGLNFYLEGHFEHAEKIFTELEVKRNDGPSITFNKRCKEFIENPPSDWNGVYTLTSK